MTMFWKMLLLAASVVVAAGRKFPDFVKVCSRDDPNLNACITDSVMALRPHLALGVPELSLPGIEPLVLGDLKALDGAGINMVAKGVSVRGASLFELSAMNVNPAESFSFHVKFPKLSAEASYEITGRLLLFPLFGNGPFSAEFNDVNGDVNIKFRVTNGHLEIEALSVKATVGGGRAELGGDSMPGAINNFINSNFETIVMAIMPSVESALSQKILEIAGHMIAGFSYDELFPKGIRV